MSAMEQSRKGVRMILWITTGLFAAMLVPHTPAVFSVLCVLYIPLAAVNAWRVYVSR